MPCKTAEQIKILFGLDTLGGPRHIIDIRLLDVDPDPPMVRGGTVGGIAICTVSKYDF